MTTTVIVYIIYAFILYSAYCFGLGVKGRNEEMIASTTSTIRLLFFIKTSLQVIHTYKVNGTLDSLQLVLYGLDTLIVFIFVHFVHVSLENPIVFIKKRNMLRK